MAENPVARTIILYLIKPRNSGIITYIPRLNFDYFETLSDVFRLNLRLSKLARFEQIFSCLPAQSVFAPV